MRLFRLFQDVTDCGGFRSVQVGQFYHASENSAPIAKIDWHPWGEAASTLLIMTVDGKLRLVPHAYTRSCLHLFAGREYDISLDTEEPQQVLSFVAERKSKSYLAEDASEREVVSFTLGKGRADWGPLTVYALMKSGDIYAICPYLPKNAYVSVFHPLTFHQRCFSVLYLRLIYIPWNVSFPPNKNFSPKIRQGRPKTSALYTTTNKNTSLHSSDNFLRVQSSLRLLELFLCIPLLPLGRRLPNKAHSYYNPNLGY